MDAWYNCQTVGISRGHELWCQQGTSSTRIRACLERAKLNGLALSNAAERAADSSIRRPPPPDRRRRRASIRAGGAMPEQR